MKHDPIHPVDATRFGSASVSHVRDMLADETPIALVYNGHPHAVMMATPADLDDFAYGFTLTEGIVEQIAEIELVDRFSSERGVSMHLLIPRARFLALDQRQRNLTGRTGCGLCGTGTLEAAIRPVRRVTSTSMLDVQALLRAFRKLQRSQPMNKSCGALHAAAILHAEGQMLVREDVGRHNAVDKVLGAAARNANKPEALLVTSRASYEVVHKAAQANCPIVAAISAPTRLAVQLAEEAGITLIGFARGDRLTVYTGRLAGRLDSRAVPAGDAMQSDAVVL